MAVGIDEPGVPSSGRRRCRSGRREA
jgi:hypothetical protein